MPPEDKLKVDIDPIFKGNNGVLNKPNQEVNQSSGIYSVLNNQQYTPSLPQTDPSPVTPKTPNKTTIHTYRDDIQEAIKANHLSSVNIAVAENDRMRQKITGQTFQQATSSAPSKTKPLIITTLLILVLILGGYFAYTKFANYQSNNNPVANIIIPSPFITSEYRNEFNISKWAKNRIVSGLSSQLTDTNVPLGNIYSLYLTQENGSSTKKILGTSDFLTLLESNIPDNLARNLKSNFMVGTFSFAQNIPFIILETSNHELAYAGLLDWEKRMENDFSTLFKLQNSNRGVATSTENLFVNKFTDEVINNQDTRVLKDEQGKIIFVYGLIGKQYIIITQNEMGFKELLIRLNREKSLKR